VNKIFRTLADLETSKPCVDRKIIDKNERYVSSMELYIELLERKFVDFSSMKLLI
jgi:hypothetical protein